MLEFLQIRNLWYHAHDIWLQILTVLERAGERARRLVLSQRHLAQASRLLLCISPPSIVFQLYFLQNQAVGKCASLSACAWTCKYNFIIVSKNPQHIRQNISSILSVHKVWKLKTIPLQRREAPGSIYRLHIPSLQLQTAFSKSHLWKRWSSTWEWENWIPEHFVLILYWVILS